MRRLLLLFTIPWLLAADDHWVKFTRGPFEVMTDAARGPHARPWCASSSSVTHSARSSARTTCRRRCRCAFSSSRTPKGWTSAAPVTEGRDRYTIVLGEKSPVTPEIYSELTRLFLKSNTTQMPAAFERGLISFFSTFEVNGIRITVGKPPAKPDLDWARIHLLVVDPDYFGKIRVLLYNLRHGVADDPAYRNAFGKSAAEVEAAAKKHFAAGNFQTTSLSSRPMSEADFPERQVSDAEAGLARARSAGRRAIGRRISETACGTREGGGSRRGTRPAGAARGPHGRGAQEFRRRHGSRQHQRALLHRVCQAGARRRTRPSRRCSKRWASIPSWTNPSP